MRDRLLKSLIKQNYSVLNDTIYLNSDEVSIADKIKIKKEHELYELKWFKDRQTGKYFGAFVYDYDIKDTEKLKEQMLSWLRSQGYTVLDKTIYIDQEIAKIEKERGLWWREPVVVNNFQDYWEEEYVLITCTWDNPKTYFAAYVRKSPLASDRSNTPH